jgi:6-phosphofructokinase 1
MLKGNAIVGQSGGPTAAINATLSGVIRGARDCGAIKTLYGAYHGVEGMLKGDVCDLFSLCPDDASCRLLEQTPAAALGSCRKKLPKMQDDIAPYEQLLAFFKQYDIRYFFYIGGNDSMDTVAKVSAYVESCGYEMRVVGVPKTIDNDLAATDHTPGFGSAAKYIAVTMQEILRDCAVYTIPAVTIVEIMGRDAGWLTAAAALTGRIAGVAPDYVYLPEVPFDFDAFYADVEKALARHPNVVIAVSEGVRMKDGTYVGASAQNGAKDVFGHAYLSGTGKVLEQAVKAKFGCKVRSIELNLPQRCASHIASKTDLCESVAVGRAAVENAVKGASGVMMAFVREEGESYSCRVEGKAIATIANAVRCVPEAYLTEEKNHINEAGLDYLFPLIQGEVDLVYENGLPKHITLK